MTRYRQISSFGSTIRGWSSNASEMKKLAARDYEDLLQVISLPLGWRWMPNPYLLSLLV